MKYYLFSYSGPVEEFGRCITAKWTAQTRAISEKQARSNLLYQYKKQFRRESNAKISLPGKITCLG